MERLLDEVSFEAPHMAGVRVEITADQVRKQLTNIVTNQDLSRYIL
jgi:ATP-dependent HslUV protease ATP-binding subunit HslU